MRTAQLLTVARGARGSAPLESILAIALLLFMVLAVVEIVFLLYARNVVAAAAHEGARAAVELGSDPRRAEQVAERSVRAAAGGLVERLRVRVVLARSAERATVRVRVEGVLGAFGPVPLAVPLSTTATSSRPALPL